MRYRFCILFAVVFLFGCGGGGGAVKAPEARSVNTRPVADAGLDRSVLAGSSVVLDGSGSVDMDGETLSYAWSIVSAPVGSAATLSSSTDIGPVMATDLAGVYTVSLVVSDGSEASLPDTITINSSMSPAIDVASNLPDTGASQYRCFDAYQEVPCPGPGERFFGQDQQYITNPVGYSLGAGGVVTDTVTGLSWVAADGRDDYNWYEAAGVFDPVSNPADIDVCGAVTALGRSDWRLPTITELSGVVDYGEYSPAIDSAYFSSIASGRYWSSSDQPSGLNLLGAWMVDMADGSTGVYRKGDWPGRVVCVSGQAWGAGSFIDNGDLTVTDSASGLMWATADAQGLDWEGALVYCEQLSVGKYDDWRVPDIRELSSLIDTSRFMPSIDESYLKCTSTNMSSAVGRSYWSSTTYMGHAAGNAWLVSFDAGVADHDGKTSTGHRVRCVR